LKIIEVFHSIQGEGPSVGRRTLFIRLAKCNLRCTWCDTQYSWEDGYDYSIEDILKEIKKYNVHYVCITGGEPLLQKEEVKKIIEVLSKTKAIKDIEIETNGTIEVSSFVKYKKATISMDIKCPSSGIKNIKKTRYDNLKYLRTKDHVKFVIKDSTDYEFAREVLRKYIIKSEIIFQPVWGINPKWLTEHVLNDQLNVRVQLQTHKYIWGEEKGH